MKKTILPLLGLVALAACQSQPDSVKSKLDAYATVEIGGQSFAGISDNGKQVLDYYKLISGEIDNIAVVNRMLVLFFVKPVRIRVRTDLESIDPGTGHPVFFIPGIRVISRFRGRRFGCSRDPGRC